MSTGPKLLKSITAAILSLLFAAQTSFAAAPIVTDGNTRDHLDHSRERHRCDNGYGPRRHRF